MMKDQLAALLAIQAINIVGATIEATPEENSNFCPLFITSPKYVLVSSNESQWTILLV